MPGPVKKQAAALLAEGRSDEALVVCERAWDHMGDRYPSFFGMILDILTATKGPAIAEARARAELSRTDLAPRAEGLVVARLAWMYGDCYPVGAWKWRVPDHRGVGAVRLAELAWRRAPELPVAAAPLAVVRAYQGQLDDAASLAKGLLRQARPRPDWAYYTAAMTVVLGMVAAGHGDVPGAAEKLEQARTIHPASDLIPALEESLIVAHRRGERGSRAVLAGAARLAVAVAGVAKTQPARTASDWGRASSSRIARERREAISSPTTMATESIAAIPSERNTYVGTVDPEFARL